MRTITADELQLAPSSLVDGALRGEPAIVTVDRVPVMMVVPLGVGTGVHRILIDLAATLFDRGQVSLGTAARMNQPATIGKNWKFRLLPGQLTSAPIAARLRRMASCYDRLPH